VPSPQDYRGNDREHAHGDGTARVGDRDGQRRQPAATVTDHPGEDGMVHRGAVRYDVGRDAEIDEDDQQGRGPQNRRTKPT
jgi:hypothetical protein